MSKMNLHDEIKNKFGFCKAVGTGAASPIIDRKGYNGVEFHFLYGLTASVADTLTVTLKEGDTTGALTSVANTYLQGTEALASRLAVTGHTSGTSINVAKSLGYTGNKRYVQATVVASGTATMIVGCNCTLFCPEVAVDANF